MSSEHYFAPSADAPHAPRSVDLVLPDLAVQLQSDSHMFSPDRIDIGTKLLLVEGPDPVAGDQVLADVGAGYGPIAVTLATRNPHAVVWAIEVNERARSCCLENVQALGLSNVHVAAPCDVPPEVRFDRIWSNPPIRIGKAALHDLLATWLGKLQPHGSGHLVVQKHLGADSLARWLAENGWATSRRTSRKAFRLLDVAARRESDPNN